MQCSAVQCHVGWRQLCPRPGSSAAMNYLCSLVQSMKCAVHSAVFRQAQASTRPSEHQAQRAPGARQPGSFHLLAGACPALAPALASGTWSCQPTLSYRPLSFPPSRDPRTCSSPFSWTHPRTQQCGTQQCGSVRQLLF